MALTTLPRYKTASGAAWAECGSGQPLLLLHGVGMRAEAWQPQIEALSTKARVIALDLPGHGQTPPLPGAPELGDFVAWFAHVVDALELDTFSLAGHSMGALVATGFAVTQSARLNRVALLNAVHKRDERARAAVQARADDMQRGRIDRNAPLARWFHPGEQGSAACQAVHHLLHTVDATGYAAAYRAFAAGDAVYADGWPDVHCPALFLTGADDANSTPDMARQMAAAAPNGRAVVIEGHRHMVNLTAPERVNAILADWLDWSGDTLPPAHGEDAHARNI